MAEQFRNPFRIFHVGLASRNLLYVLCVCHHDLESSLSFQDGVNRLPIHPRTLHGHVSTVLREQPFTQGQQLSCGGPEGPDLLVNLSFFETINKQATTVA